MSVPRDPVLSALSVLLFCSALQAAEKSKAPLTPPREDAPLSEPEVAPRGRHAPRDITYSPWQKLCFKVPGKDLLCRTSTTGTWDTGQMAIRIDVIERQGSARLQILLPVGLYLRSGVKLKVDTSAREVEIPFNWCFSNLCVAAAPASRDMIKALERSSEAFGRRCRHKFGYAHRDYPHQPVCSRLRGRSGQNDRAGHR